MLVIDMICNYPIMRRVTGYSVHLWVPISTKTHHKCTSGNWDLRNKFSGKFYQYLIPSTYWCHGLLAANLELKIWHFPSVPTGWGYLVLELIFYCPKEAVAHLVLEEFIGHVNRAEVSYLIGFLSSCLFRAKPNPEWWHERKVIGFGTLRIPKTWKWMKSTA